MTTQKMLVLMANNALASDDIQHIKSVLMDMMGLMGLDPNLKMPEPRITKKTRAEIKMIQIMHEKRLNEIHRPL